MKKRVIAGVISVLVLLHSFSAAAYAYTAAEIETSDAAAITEVQADESTEAEEIEEVSEAEESAVSGMSAVVEEPVEAEEPKVVEKPVEAEEPEEVEELSEAEESAETDSPAETETLLSEAADESAAAETGAEQIVLINPVYQDLAGEELIRNLEDPDSGVSVDSLIDAGSLSEAGDALREVMIDREEAVSLSLNRNAEECRGFDTEALCLRIIESAFREGGDCHGGDYLRFHCAGFGVRAVTADENVQLNFRMSYLSTSEQESEVDRIIAEVIDSLDLHDAEDAAKAASIYSYIADNVQSIEKEYDEQFSISDCSAYAALVNKDAFCQGIACLFYRLSREAGLDSRIISGELPGHRTTELPHTWNVMKVGQEYYYADPALDAGRRADEFLYFLKGEESFSDHVKVFDDWTGFTGNSFESEYPVESDNLLYGEETIVVSDNGHQGMAGSLSGSDALIILQPEDVVAAEGERVRLRIEAGRDGCTYQWQWSKDGAYWKNCTSAGYNTDTFSFKMSSSLDGRHYRCIVTGGDRQETSNEAVIILKSEEALITVQPGSVSAAIGEKVILHLEVNAASPSYQWQWSPDGVKWKNCTSRGFDTDTFSFSMTTGLNGRNYRCIVSAGAAQQISDAALITLRESTLRITEQPQDTEALEGEKVSLHLEAAGTELTYQWQWSPDGTKWKNCTSRGFNTDTFGFTMTASLDGRHYRCVVSQGGQQAVSDEALITLGEDTMQITLQPDNVEAEEGEKVVLHVEAVGTGLSYRWQWSTDGEIWKNCTSRGYATDTFSFKMVQSLNNRQYHCVITNVSGTKLISYSALITLKTQGNALPEDLQMYEILTSQTDENGIQTASFKYGTSVLGRDLIAWTIVPRSYDRTMLLNFEIHGWEDLYAGDGQYLVDLGNAVVSHYSETGGLNGCRLIVIPSCNPDGLADGTTNNGFGRCNADGIDLNRDFDADYQSNSSARNYTPYAFSGKESAALRDLVLVSDPFIAIDFHGWENCTIGNSDVGEPFSIYCGLNHKNEFSTSAHGYFAHWAETQGAKGLLVEFKNPDTLVHENVFAALDCLIEGDFGAESKEGIDDTFNEYCPLTTYTLSSGRVYVQQKRGNTGTSYGYIDGAGDKCTIIQVYADGWCKVRYPVSGYTKTGFCKFSEFYSEDHAVSPYEATVSQNTTVYTTSDLSTSLGSVWTTDVFTVIAEKDGKLQIIYPLDSGGYKMGWINKSSIISD